jgi:hypothetical protein
MSSRYRYQTAGGSVTTDQPRIMPHARTRYDARLTEGETPRIERALRRAVTAPAEVCEGVLSDAHNASNQDIQLARVRAGEYTRDVAFVVADDRLPKAVVTCYPVSLVSGRGDRRAAREWLDEHHGRPTEARHE